MIIILNGKLQLVNTYTLIYKNSVKNSAILEVAIFASMATESTLKKTVGVLAFENVHSFDIALFFSFSELSFKTQQ